MQSFTDLRSGDVPDVRQKMMADGKKQAQKLGKDASENLNILNKAYKIEWKLQEVNKNLLKS